VKQPPIPLEEVIRWCEANRPDAVAYLRRLEGSSDTPLGEASLLLVSLAFAAGRSFQAAPVNQGVNLPQIVDPYSGGGRRS
jgi:hypothetical protein